MKTILVREVMNMKKKWLAISVLCVTLAVLMVAGLALAGCTPQKPSEMTKVTVALDWLPFGRHTPYYIAMDKGWFAEENLEVEIKPTFAAGIQEIGAGNVDFAETTQGTAVILAVQQGIPIKAVCGEFQGDELGWYGLKSKNPDVKTVADMAGLSVNGPASKDDDVRAFLSISGMEGKTNWVIMEGSVYVGAALRGEVDAFISVSGSEAYCEGLGGCWVINFSDGGYTTFPGAMMAAHTDLIENRPEVVRAFVRAYLKGLQYVLDHPQEAFDSLRANYPDAEDFQKILIDVIIQLRDTPNTVGKPLGWMSEKDWEISQDIVAEWSSVARIVKRPVSDYFTNEFLP